MSERAAPSGTQFVAPAVPTQLRQPMGQQTGNGQRIVSGLLEGFGKIVEKHHEDMRIQGITDAVAQQVQEVSWLSKPGYDQGVKFVQYTEQVASLNKRAAEVAWESANAGETPQQYNERMQPLLQELNSSIHDLGLTGKSKAQAQAQLVKQATLNLQQYEEARQQVTLQRIEIGKANLSAQLMGAVATNPSPQQVAVSLEDTLNGAYTLIQRVSKNPLQDASAVVEEGYLAALKASSIRTAEGRKQLQALNAGLDSMVGKLDAGTLHKLQGAVIDKVREAQDFVGDEARSEVDRVEVQIADGMGFPTSAYQAMYSANQRRAKNGELRSSDAASMNTRLTGLYIKAQAQQKKLEGASPILDGSTYTQRTAMGVTEDEHAKSIYELVARNTDFTKPNGAAEYASALLQIGTLTQNDKIRKRGLELLTASVVSALETDPQTLKTEGVSAEAQENWKMIQALYQKNPDLRESIEKQIPEEKRDAFATFASGSSADFAAVLQRIHKGSDVQQVFQQKIPTVTVDDLSRVRINPFKERTLVNRFGMFDGKRYWIVQSVNNLIKQYMPEAMQSGRILKDGAAAVQWLEQKGAIVQSKYGTVALSNPTIWDGTEAAGSGNYLLQRQVFDTIHEDVARSLGDASAEDVYFRQGQDGTIQVYHREGNAIFSDTGTELFAADAYVGDITPTQIAQYAKRAREAQDIKAMKNYDQVAQEIDGVALTKRWGSSALGNEGFAVAKSLQQAYGSDSSNTYGLQHEGNITPAMLGKVFTQRMQGIDSTLERAIPNKGWLLPEHSSTRLAAAHVHWWSQQNTALPRAFVNYFQSEDKAGATAKLKAEATKVHPHVWKTLKELLNAT